MAGLTTLRGELRQVPSTRNDVGRTLLDIATGTLLFLAGAATGLVCGFTVAWFAWVEQTGTLGMVLAYAGAASYVVMLFVGCRLGAVGMDGRVGAFLPAAGWILATLAVATFNTGGDVVFGRQIVNYVVLYGGVFVVAAAVITAPIGPRVPRRASGGKDLTTSSGV
ncbi:hypothetical protein J4H86_10370 [Spiractinospora alimapuensis]|uniref:DUF6113 family protein n=1 Tax=Spiractinospora alimapuensis TaxID=2820884 RepID=UPI001F35D4F8|nr:DUF6113 family protein [Spiractinospora alimapuensis]QVQ54062.1 hypothetical protein J4H86_10370 [Spiractinospora alimapuensis]